MNDWAVFDLKHRFYVRFHPSGWSSAPGIEDLVQIVRMFILSFFKQYVFLYLVVWIKELAIFGCNSDSPPKTRYSQLDVSGVQWYDQHWAKLGYFMHSDLIGL